MIRNNAMLGFIIGTMIYSCSNHRFICSGNMTENQKSRIIVTSDGEIDDECSMVRFLLYANEWDVEGIVTSSSQYHWHGHRWAGDDWIETYLDAYAQVYKNLVKHDTSYPAPDYLRDRTALGNVMTEGEMDEVTDGSQLIVKVLLDETDERPVWLQAWGGPNTIARALKTIEEEHPQRMAEVAKKIRFFFIWEQDSTYQSYIRPHWGQYHIPTIICDQFWAIAYQWNKILPKEKQTYFAGGWMKSNILENHGPLCALYKAHVQGSHGLSGDIDFNEGDFRSEGDSPSFIYLIPTGLQNPDHPGWGSWGGRYVRVRENTWLDCVPDSTYQYPNGRWYTRTAWGRTYMREIYPEHQDLIAEYFKPVARWTDALQNDFASRADWCVKSYNDANHPPLVKVINALVKKVKPGSIISLNAEGTTDPDGDGLNFCWWHYQEAGSYQGTVEINHADEQQKAYLTVPEGASKGENIHIICQVTDTGIPPLTRYQRVVIKVE